MELPPEIVEIVKAIGEAGLFVIVAAFFLWMVYQNHSQAKKREAYEMERSEKESKLQQENQQKMQEYMMQLAMGKAGANHAKEDKVTNNLNAEINEILLNGLKETEADRVLFFSYHNGGVDYTGVSYQKMSCINEVVRKGIVPIQQKYGNIFRTTMYTIYTELNSNNYFNIPDVDSLDDGSMVHLCKEDNSHAIFGCTINNRDQDAIGFICFCYSSKYYDYQKIVPVIKRTKYKIEGAYLTLHK